MAKIVIDARELRTSTGRYIERLLHYLQEIDNVNDYTVLLKPKDIDSWTPTNKKFTKEVCPFKEFTFAEQTALLAQIKKIAPDLVHFGMVQQPVLYKGKTVTTMHDLTTTRFRNPSKNWLIFTIKQYVYKWVTKKVAIKSDAIITPSEFVKDDVAKYAKVNSRKITVTYEAADEITEAPEPINELINQSFIFYVGRSTPHKNLVRLIASFVILKEKQPRLRLVIVGKMDSLKESLAKNAHEMGATDVDFLDYVSDGQLKWLYQNCLAYVFPSLSEGFGLPGLEAMVEGAPVVSSNATCLPEIYGDAAHYFDPLDVKDMATKINSVLTNKKLRDRLIKAGKSQVRKYSWKKMAEQTLEVYNSVLGQID